MPPPSARFPSSCMHEGFPAHRLRAAAQGLLRGAGLRRRRPIATPVDLLLLCPQTRHCRRPRLLTRSSERDGRQLVMAAADAGIAVADKARALHWVFKVGDRPPRCCCRRVLRVAAPHARAVGRIDMLLTLIAAGRGSQRHASFPWLGVRHEGAAARGIRKRLRGNLQRAVSRLPAGKACPKQLAWSPWLCCAFSGGQGPALCP